jgi:cell division transport system permease protein
VETTVGVTVFFNEGTTEERILEIQSQIEEREEVNEVHYTSAEEAWKLYKEKAFPEGDNEVLTNLDNDNPLAESASLEVYLNDAGAQEDLVKFINTIADVRKVNASESVANSFASFGRLLGYVSLAIIVILLAVAIFLISNTVRVGIDVRRDEITIMKYLGATDFFVRAPFLVEGAIIGLIGSVIPLVVVRFLYKEIVSFVTAQFSVLNNLLHFLPARSIFIILIPVTLVIRLGIGFLGSYITLIRRVRV